MHLYEYICIGFDEASNAFYKKPENEIEKYNYRFIGEQR
jgi:hypothetical protein